MAHTVWEVAHTQWCERVAERVSLEVCRVYPAERMPDQPPRVIARRCSKAMACNELDRPTCCWAGSLPGYDPFL